MKKLICKIIGHKLEKILCPYTKVMYNVCNRCAPKHQTVSRFQ